jgi:hypothetical protein
MSQTHPKPYLEYAELILRKEKKLRFSSKLETHMYFMAQTLGTLCAYHVHLSRRPYINSFLFLFKKFLLC